MIDWSAIPWPPSQIIKVHTMFKSIYFQYGLVVSFQLPPLTCGTEVNTSKIFLVSDLLLAGSVVPGLLPAESSGTGSITSQNLELQDLWPITTAQVIEIWTEVLAT